MQHINLYHQLDHVVEPPFSARQQLWIVSAVTVIMVLVYIGLLVTQGGIDDSLATAQQRQNQVAETLAQLEARKAVLLQDNALLNEIEQLQQGVAFRRKLLAGIDPSEGDAKNGFAEHMQGLARRHIDGLWFTEIQLQQGGSHMVLKGQARQPELLPRYLQELSAEPVFRGQQFSVLRMSLPEDQPGVMNFELRSEEVDVVDE